MKKEEQDNKKKHVDARIAADVGRSAVDQVRKTHTTNYENTGTNVSYEGPTAPGSGGSAGTGNTSGHSGVEPKIHTPDAYETGNASKNNKDEKKTDDE